MTWLLVCPQCQGHLRPAEGVASGRKELAVALVRASASCASWAAGWPFMLAIALAMVVKPGQEGIVTLQHRRATAAGRVVARHTSSRSDASTPTFSVANTRCLCSSTRQMLQGIICNSMTDRGMGLVILHVSLIYYCQVAYLEAYIAVMNKNCRNP